MNEKNNSEISFNDPVFSPLILFSLENYLKRTRESGAQSKTIYNLTLQTLEKLDFFPSDESDPSSFTIGVHIYNPIYENSIKQLEEQGLVEREDKKLLLTEDGFKVLKSLISRFNAHTSPDIFQFLDNEIDAFNENITSQSKVIMKGHKEIIAQLRKIGSQMDQHFPDFLSEFQKQLLCFIYNSKNGEITTEGYNKFTKLMKLKCHKNSPYKTLKILEEKGFIKNYGESRICYKLTKLGRVQARWYVGREIS